MKSKEIDINKRIDIVQGDITNQNVDAIVNAANNSLLGGGGVDGAIHRAAGPKLLEECKKLGGCETGSAKITKGYNLPSRYVIHTVGPVWQGGDKKEDELLAKCYKSCFEIARQKRFKTIAFPSISTGVYRFPVEKASHIALNEIKQELEENTTLEKIVIVCFDSKTYNAYLSAKAEIFKNE